MSILTGQEALKQELNGWKEPMEAMSVQVAEMNDIAKSIYFSQIRPKTEKAY